jgi:hypothetical protein
MSESVEADFVRNLAFDSEAYGVLCDRLGRCLQRLGLERVSRDVTPSLQSYLQRPSLKKRLVIRKLKLVTRKLPLNNRSLKRLTPRVSPTMTRKLAAIMRV